MAKNADDLNKKIGKRPVESVFRGMRVGGPPLYFAAIRNGWLEAELGV